MISSSGAITGVPTADGTYNISTDGQVNGYIQPRLAFGERNAYGFVPWVFAATFVAGLVGSVLAGRWLARSRRTAVASAQPLHEPVIPVFNEPGAQPVPVGPEPTDQGVRLEQLKTLTALRDSGALTEKEFQSEKRRILESY